MNCDDLRALMAATETCEQTEYGARFVTHCMYPSFDPVSVFVAKVGDGYKVTDGGGALGALLRHGRDDAAFQSALKKACGRFSVATAEGMLLAEVDDAEWLRAAVLAVANASSMAAAAALEHVAASTERELTDKIYDELRKVAPESNIAKEYQYRGESGRMWRVDYAVLGREPLLVKAVTPFYASIASNYTAFGDIGANDNVPRFSVYSRELKAEDAALMRQVAQLVPLRSLEPGARRELARVSA